MEQEGVITVDYINLAGRHTVAEQKWTSVKTHQNIWKAESFGGIVELCCPAGGAKGEKVSTGASQP